MEILQSDFEVAARLAHVEPQVGLTKKQHPTHSTHGADKRGVERRRRLIIVDLPETDRVLEDGMECRHRASTDVLAASRGATAAAHACLRGLARSDIGLGALDVAEGERADLARARAANIFKAISLSAQRTGPPFLAS